MMDYCQGSESCPDRRALDPQVDTLVNKVTRMADDMDKLATGMTEMSKQMGRLVLAEERITHITASVAGTQSDLRTMSERIGQMELAMVRLQGSSKWVDMAIIGIVVTACTLVANKLVG